MTAIRKIHVYGLGAIGSNLLLQLAKQLPDMEFTGYDFDKVEARNIGPQAYFLEHIGQPKALVVSTVLRRFLRSPKYTAVNSKVEKPLLHAPEGTLILDCFDNTKSRKLLTESKGHVFHTGFSPFYTAEGMWSPGYDVPHDVPSNAPDLCTLPDATSFIHYVVNAAALNIMGFLLNDEKRDFIVTPTKSRIPQLRYL